MIKKGIILKKFKKEKLWKKLPIKSAKDISEIYNQDQVMLVTFDKKNNLVHTVSYGKSKKDCKEAAQRMNFVRKALGFPEEACNLMPARIKKDESNGQ